MSPRKSSSLRTRSSVTRPSSRMRSTRRAAMSAKTTAKPELGAERSATGPATPSSRWPAGRLSIAPTTSSMPSGLTCGAPARAERSAKRVGAKPAAMTTVCRPEGDGDVGARRPHPGRRDDGHRLEDAGGGLPGDGAEHDADRPAQGGGGDGAQGAGAAEHDGGVPAVGEHERAQVVRGVDRVHQRGPQDLGDGEQGDGDDQAVDDQGRPAGAADPAGEQAAGDQRRDGADEQQDVVDAEAVELRAGEGAGQQLGDHERQRAAAMTSHGRRGLRGPCRGSAGTASRRCWRRRRRGRARPTACRCRRAR